MRDPILNYYDFTHGPCSHAKGTCLPLPASLHHGRQNHGGSAPCPEATGADNCALCVTAWSSGVHPRGGMKQKSSASTAENDYCTAVLSHASVDEPLREISGVGGLRFFGLVLDCVCVILAGCNFHLYNETTVQITHLTVARLFC